MNRSAVCKHKIVTAKTRADWFKCLTILSGRVRVMFWLPAGVDNDAGGIITTKRK